MRSIFAILLGGSVLAPAASATWFYNSAGGDSNLQLRDDAKVETRFKADITNWDTRLEFDGHPNNGDLTGHVSNSRSYLENTAFGFELSYDHSASEVSWVITDGDEVKSSLTQSVSEFGTLNTIQLFTSGSRGDVAVSGVEFAGLGLMVDDFPDFSTPTQSGSTFAETWLFFGNAFDLLTGDWSLTGGLDFNNLATNRNPNEGSKIAVKLRNAEDLTTPGIPGPASAAVLLGAGAMAARRRRV